MTATQISFVEFALTEQASCTPSVTLPAAAVAADGGECISYGGVFEPFRGTRWNDFRREFYEWDDLETGAGMDAPAFLPTGGHRSFSHSGLTGGRCVLAQGQEVPFYRY
jgi:hypothetical protein